MTESLEQLSLRKQNKDFWLVNYQPVNSSNYGSSLNFNILTETISQLLRTSEGTDGSTVTVLNPETVSNSCDL